MAINYGDGSVGFIGAVIGETTYLWMDGMLSEYAVVFDSTDGTVKNIQTGYYGCDGRNMDATTFDIDMTRETAKQIIKSFKAEAIVKAAEYNQNLKTEIKKGIEAEVVRGRKIPKGTKGKVFWTGEKETYQSRMNSWMHETELIAGIETDDGNRIFIKAEYLKNLTGAPDMTDAENDKFVSDYIRKRCDSITGLRVDILKMAM